MTRLSESNLTAVPYVIKTINDAFSIYKISIKKHRRKKKNLKHNCVIGPFYGADVNYVCTYLIKKIMFNIAK